MISFNQYLEEAADSAQNLHMTHADEDLFERGDKGAVAAVEFCKDIVRNVGRGSTKLTVKWDGAPAIFAGHDPKDGQFFVGTKSVFAKNPKLYKTHAEIDAQESGGKADKLHVALEELRKIGIPKGEVLQGDILWTTGDLKHETIDGKRWVTAHPNTIVYAWESESETGKAIKNSLIGVVFHTVYKGRGDLANYKASYGYDVSKLKRTRTVWFDDANYKGADVAFSEAEIAEVVKLVKRAESLIGGFDGVAQLMHSLPSGAVGAGVKTYINSLIRNGKLPKPATAAKDYVNYLNDYWEEKVVAKVKTESSKEKKRAALEQFKAELRNNMSALQRAFEFVDAITQAKMLIVTKLNDMTKNKMFVKTASGFKVTAPEGYVAISGEKGEAVKFIDRLSFSHFNFSKDYLKGWESAKR